MKLKSIGMAKDIFIQKNRQTTEWEEIFTKFISHRGLILQIYGTHGVKVKKQILLI